MTEPTDAQSTAFREASPDDWDERSLIEQPEGTLDDLEPEGALHTAADYEADDWDSEAAGAKTREQAAEDLAARIADDACPDSAGEAGAYDTEET